MSKNIKSILTSRLEDFPFEARPGFQRGGNVPFDFFVAGSNVLLIRESCKNDTRRIFNSIRLLLIIIKVENACFWQSKWDLLGGEKEETPVNLKL
jgi:hypothetical protein